MTPPISADVLIKALQAQGIQVKGINIKDPNDPTTWVLEGVADDQRDAAIAALTPLLTTPPEKPAPWTRLRFLRLWLQDEYAALLNLEQQPIDNAACVYQLALLRASEGTYDTQDARQLIACARAAKVLTADRVTEMLQLLGVSK